MQSFRDLMELCDIAQEAHEADHDVRFIIDGKDFVLFFVKDKTMYGAPEESRVTFARMKAPTEDETEGWVKEATFSATDLLKMLNGEKIQRIFNYEDMKDIKVLDKDKAAELLSKKVQQLEDKKEVMKNIKQMAKSMEPLIPYHLADK